MGKEFVVSVPHQLSEDEALRRIKLLVADLKTRYGTQVSNVTEQWRDNRCEFSLKMKMFKIAGSILVQGSAVEIRGKMPPGTGRFEGRAKSLIEDGAKSLLA